jgi:hypothetical protein
MKHLKTFEERTNAFDNDDVVPQNNNEISEDLLTVLKWINIEYDEDWLNEYFQDGAMNYCDSRDAADYYEVEEDELDDMGVDYGEVYQNLCMGGAVSYDCMSEIENGVKHRYPEEYEKYREFIDNFISGLVGSQGWDSLNCHSTPEYEEAINKL